MTKTEFLRQVFEEAMSLLDKGDAVSLKYWCRPSRYHVYLHRSEWLTDGFSLIMTHHMLEWDAMPDRGCYAVLVQRPNLIVMQGAECSETLIKDGSVLYASLRHGSWTKSLSKESLDW